MFEPHRYLTLRDHAMPVLTICDSNSGLDKASYLMRLSDEADRGQPEEEHKAEVDGKFLEERMWFHYPTPRG